MYCTLKRILNLCTRRSQICILLLCNIVVLLQYTLIGEIKMPQLNVLLSCRFLTPDHQCMHAKCSKVVIVMGFLSFETLAFMKIRFKSF